MTQTTFLAAGLLVSAFALHSCSSSDAHVQARRVCDEYLEMVRSLDTEAPVPDEVIDRAYAMISDEDRAFIDASFAVYSQRDEAAWSEHLADPAYGPVEAVWYRKALESEIDDREGFRDVAMEAMVRYDCAVFHHEPIYRQSRRIEPGVTEVTYGVPPAMGATSLIGRPFNIAHEDDGEFKLAYTKNILRYSKALRVNEAQDRGPEEAGGSYTAAATLGL